MISEQKYDVTDQTDWSIDW